MRFSFALALALFFSIASATAALEFVEQNSCYVEGRVLSVVSTEDYSNVSFETIETSRVSNESVQPCFFQANEEVTAVYEHPTPCVVDCVQYFVELTAGDVFTGRLSKTGEDWNPINELYSLSINEPNCPSLNDCGIKCDPFRGLARDGKGCFKCACREQDDSLLGGHTNLIFHSFEFVNGWNFFSYPASLDRDAFCQAGQYCENKRVPLPKIAALNCSVENAVWGWVNGARSYAEFQLPDVGKKENTPFAAQLLTGYWIKASEPCVVTVFGTVGAFYGYDDATGKQLLKGWNSIGAGGTGGSPFGQVYSEEWDLVKGDCVAEKGPYGWNAEKQEFFKTASLVQGNAYFVKLKSDCVMKRSQPSISWG